MNIEIDIDIAYQLMGQLIREDIEMLTEEVEDVALLDFLELCDVHRTDVLDTIEQRALLIALTKFYPN